MEHLKMKNYDKTSFLKNKDTIKYDVLTCILYQIRKTLIEIMEKE